MEIITFADEGQLSDYFKDSNILVCTTIIALRILMTDLIFRDY